VVSNAEADNNIWLNHSELSIAGRPLKPEKIVLPRQRELCLPESMDASSDLRIADRQRPSPEQIRAQKGRMRMSAMWQSLFNMSEYDFDGPVVICNFTGYVEDCGLSVPGLD